MEDLAPQDLTSEEREAAAQAAFAAIDKADGERYASDKIAFARRMYSQPQQQANELRFWYGVAKAFPAHAPYSMPLIAAEINRLEAMR